MEHKKKSLGAGGTALEARTSEVHDTLRSYSAEPNKTRVAIALTDATGLVVALFASPDGARRFLQGARP